VSEAVIGERSTVPETSVSTALSGPIVKATLPSEAFDLIVSACAGEITAVGNPELGLELELTFGDGEATPGADKM
jgi:hypothetical protein